MTDFRLATLADDESLRGLLRDNAMPGWVEMVIEREPSYFAGVDRFGHDWAVLAQDEGELVGMYAASLLPLYVNGVVENVGYLGGLRVKPVHRRRIRHLRQGYASVRSLIPQAPSLPWWFTVVANDNQAARRLLEAGIRGLPRYRAIGGYTTYAMSAARGQSRALWRRLRPEELAPLLAWHKQLAAQQQLMPVLDEQRLNRIGTDAVWVCTDGDAFVGMAILWNQGDFKQVLARQYRGALRWLRPTYNAYARITRRVLLPPAGVALGQTFIAFLTLGQQVLSDQRITRDLLVDLLSHCPTPVASLGLHDAHPLLPTVLGLAPMRYAATVYAVEFDEPARLDGRPVQPEAALL